MTKEKKEVAEEKPEEASAEEEPDSAELEAELKEETEEAPVAEEAEEIPPEGAEEKAEAPEEPAEAAEEKPAPVEEEAKPEREEEAEEDVVEERFYTVPLSRAWILPGRKRAPRAMRILKSFVTKHMKLGARGEGEEEEELPRQLIVSAEVNERIWRRGVEKPPRKIRVRTTRDKEGNVTVHLAEGD